MHSNGILGNKERSGRNWVRRRERWLVVLSVILHAIYMLSNFDIYFKTPIVHGVDPITPRFAAPAKCPVLLIDASFLDMWSLDKFQSLLNKSREDPKLKELLQQDNLVVFLHFLGCDFNGHAHRPFSSIYLNNKVVDHVAESIQITILLNMSYVADSTHDPGDMLKAKRPNGWDEYIH
ncbi:hypothetical protein JHK82_031765 [Glycine max]|nr:hypothetical protein JHK86_031856 [Glycine max]KAG5125028.1 hypothetical protein JHK82_031765 [Glycine max]KAG5146453.1 hypothetical protein JHK84_031996 [Glycine max]